MCPTNRYYHLLVSLQGSRTIAETLHEAVVPVLSHQKCVDIFGEKYITDIIICVDGSQKSGPCNVSFPVSVNWFTYYILHYIYFYLFLLQTKLHNLLQGDSGGPMNYVEDGVTYNRGTVSFGSGAGCEQGFPNGYTKVLRFLDWIETKTGIAID